MLKKWGWAYYALLGLLVIWAGHSMATHDVATMSQELWNLVAKDHGGPPTGVRISPDSSCVTPAHCKLWHYEVDYEGRNWGIAGAALSVGALAKSVIVLGVVMLLIALEHFLVERQKPQKSEPNHRPSRKSGDQERAERGRANLGADILSDLDHPEAAGGVFIPGLRIGAKVEVRTSNSVYELMVTNPDEAEVVIAATEGHKLFFAQPAAGKVSGSTWGGSMLKMHFVGIGMNLELWTAADGVVTTTEIKAIKVFNS